MPTCKIVNHQGNPESIFVSKNCLICGQLAVFHHGGKISVGENSFISEGTRIWSGHSIKIGNRVLISHNVHLLDNNSHSISAMRRHQEFLDVMTLGRPTTNDGISSAEILVEDDVWIGFNSTILKGVTIGRGSIVGANSVITKDVPPYTIVAGNPARVIGSSCE